MTDCDVPNPVTPAPDPRLTADGWEQRFVADPVRAKEAAELYSSLGHEVRMEPLRPEAFDPRCSGCAAAACREYVMIYTRKKA